MNQQETIAGIVLAAGGSTRMGQPKLLLDVHGEPLIRHVVRLAENSKLMPLIVVTGAHSTEIQSVLTDFSVEIIYNPDWQKGQSTSVKAGIRALPPGADGVVILLGDQPGITKEVIQELIETHASIQPTPAIIIPEYQGKRGNPVLFDRCVFQAMSTLSGDAGARQIFTRFPSSVIAVDNPDLFADIDSPEDYLKFLKNSTDK